MTVLSAVCGLNRLCVTLVWTLLFRTLLEPMEALLQLMLKWDPVQRGGKVNSDTKKPLCFEVLEQILSMKVSCELFSLQMHYG